MTLVSHSLLEINVSVSKVTEELDVVVHSLEPDDEDEMVVVIEFLVAVDAETVAVQKGFDEGQTMLQNQKKQLEANLEKYTEHSFDPILGDETLHVQFYAKPWPGSSGMRMLIPHELVLKILESNNESDWKDQTQLVLKTSGKKWHDSLLV